MYGSIYASKMSFPMVTPCKYRLWIIAILVVAIGLSAIPAYAEGMFGETFSTTDIGIFGPVPDVTPRASQGNSGQSGDTGNGMFGETFSTTDPGVLGPVPDVTPRASRGDSGQFGDSGNGLFGGTPSVTDDGFGPTFSTTDSGVLGPVPDITPRASQNQ